VKGSDIIVRESAEVPAALRAERQRLGFDYGKFDFVIHDGEPVLLDANRTPWAARPADRAAMKSSNADLAHGIEMWLPA